MRQNSVAFGNFICRFGEAATLLDHAVEIVIPAFTDEKLRRRHGETSYFFLDVAVENVGTPTAPRPALAGRFIKDGVLRRQQVYSPEDGLRPDPQAMRTAPSAFFVLLLENHRLIYFAETADAPEMQAFAVTAKSFIKFKHDQYLRGLQERREEEGQPTTLVKLREEIPPPTLNLVALTSNTSIEAFVARYRTLKQVQITLLKPNDEFDAASMIRAVREQNTRVKAESTLIEHRSANGLNASAAVEEITEASRSGNQIVKLSGTDREGNALKGNNEHFQLSVIMEAKPESRSGLIAKLRGIFDSQVKAGAISVGQPMRDISAALRRVMTSFLP